MSDATAPLIEHITLEYERPAFYAKQFDAIYDPRRYSNIEASTKSGKTSGCIAWLLEQALGGEDGRNYWWVAPVSGQADIAFRRSMRAVPRDMFTAHMSQKTMTLINGAVVWFKSADKPDCYDDATEILTESGWKKFANLTAEDRVMTRSPSGQAEWQAPTRVVAEPYAGEMVAIVNKRIDLCVTPNHRMLIERRRGAHGRGKWDRRGPRKGKAVTKAECWTTADKLRRADTIPAQATWAGSDTVMTEDRCALLGFYLAEGAAIGNSSPDPMRLTKRCGYRIHFAQTSGLKGGDKGNVRVQFEALLTRLGYRYSERRDGLLVWDKALWHSLIELGNKYTKFIPGIVKDLPPEKLRSLLRWMVLGDGTSRRGDQWTYFTVSRQLADDVQEIAIKCGWSATILERAPKPYGRPGAKASMAIGYIVKIQKHTRSHHLAGKRAYFGKVPYTGMVYCVSVPNTTVLVRRNGKPCWSGNSLYGEDVYAAVMDEASRTKEDAWHAVRSTLTATRGPIRIIGNVKGRKNWAYLLARRAQAGDPNMGYHKIVAQDAVDAGVLDESEIEDARRVLPERVFRELYLAEASDDEGNPFGLAAIRACMHPLSRGAPVVWGIDLAKHVDWTVLIGLDAVGYVCRFERFQLPWDDTMNRIKVAVGLTPALVDSTGVGDPIVELLQKGRPNFQGYHFTPASKQKLMENLAVVIQGGRTTFPEGPIATELEQFEYQYLRTTGVRYSAPEGFHDDCVCALALAHMHKLHARAPLVVPDAALRRLGGMVRPGH